MEKQVFEKVDFHISFFLPKDTRYYYCNNLVLKQYQDILFLDFHIFTKNCPGVDV